MKNKTVLIIVGCIFVLLLLGATLLNSYRIAQRDCQDLEFAYIDADENVYRYDFCARKSKAITTDQTHPFLNQYFFYGTDATWSPDGRYLLFGSNQFDFSNQIGFLTEVESGRTELLGVVLHAVWSPAGQYIAVTRKLLDAGAPGNIAILQLQDRQMLERILGTGAVWFDDGHLLYWDGVVDWDSRETKETRLIKQTLQMYDLQSGETQNQLVNVELFYGAQQPVGSGLLSQDHKYLAFYNDGIEGMPKLRVVPLHHDRLVEFIFPLPGEAPVVSDDIAVIGGFDESVDWLR